MSNLFESEPVCGAGGPEMAGVAKPIAEKWKAPMSAKADSGALIEIAKVEKTARWR